MKFFFQLWFYHSCCRQISEDLNLEYLLVVSCHTVVWQCAGYNCYACWKSESRLIGGPSLWFGIYVYKRLNLLHYSRFKLKSCYKKRPFGVIFFMAQLRKLHTKTKRYKVFPRKALPDWDSLRSPYSLVLCPPWSLSCIVITSISIVCHGQLQLFAKKMWKEHRWLKCRAAEIAGHFANRRS